MMTLIGTLLQLVFTLLALMLRMATLASIVAGRLLGTLIAAAWRSWRTRPRTDNAVNAASPERRISDSSPQTGFTPRPLRPRRRR